MRLPATKTLVKVAVYVSVAGISSVMYMRWKIQERIRNTDFFRSAFEILRQHKGAASLLGEPIKEVGFDIGDPQNSCNSQNANMEVSVKGSKDRGKIFFTATHNKEIGWLIDSLYLELKSQPDKRYLIKKAQNDTQSQNKD